MCSNAKCSISALCCRLAWSARTRMSSSSNLWRRGPRRKKREEAEHTWCIAEQLPGSSFLLRTWILCTQVRQAWDGSESTWLMWSAVLGFSVLQSRNVLSLQGGKSKEWVEHFIWAKQTLQQPKPSSGWHCLHLEEFPWLQRWPR